MDDNGGIPEDLRCKRSDGKQWRCNALSMADKTVCEKHYYQAKRRAASSALRATAKKAKTKGLEDAGEEPELSNSLSPANNGGSGELSGSVGPAKKSKKYKVPKGQPYYSPETTHVSNESEENRTRTTSYNTPMSQSLNGFGSEEYLQRNSESSEDEELTCHQCRRSDSGNVVWCDSCDQRGYCESCIARWYPEVPIEEIQRNCPVCIGNCNCRVCFNADVLIKGKVKEISAIDKLRYLHRLLGFALPVLKQIYSEQCFEIGVETRLHGIKANIPRAKINADEQMCCDVCKIPIFDYHRHCSNCMFDLCLTCCRELRQSSIPVVKRDLGDFRVLDRTKDDDSAIVTSATFDTRTNGNMRSKAADQSSINFSLLFPGWNAASDGSVQCGPSEAGGCGSSKLVLRRIFKINWAAKLVKNAEEIVRGCKVSDTDISDRCGFCTRAVTSRTGGSSEINLCRCSHRDNSNDNFLYYPSLRDIYREGINHFHKHWVKGEPVFFKHVFEYSLATGWDPLSILRGITETMDERVKEHNVIVKAIDCSNLSEVNIDLDQFLKGYSEGCIYEDGRPKLLKLKDWPLPSALEELITYQRPEFLSNLPLIEFIHLKWGVLNLAAKLPHDALQTEVGPKIFVAYGKHQELGGGDYVSNLQTNMVDLVYLLMHTADVNTRGLQWSRTEKCDNSYEASEAVGNSYLASLDERSKSFDLSTKGQINDIEHEAGLNSTEVCNGSVMDFVEKKGLVSPYNEQDSMGIQRECQIGAIWDIFRRQDVPKLNEYLRVHCKEFKTSTTHPVNSVMYPVYDKVFFLNNDHKRKLKEELRIEPWTFEQHIGEAVFIPAGCPFQLRNLHASVQLSFGFLSPESLEESARMAHEIRSLPNDHEAKLNMLEVGKMSMYAASSAIREIQKIILDPKHSSDIRFDDRNLTAAVSENLEKMRKRRQTLFT